MGLIRVPEHRAEDLRAWEEVSRYDLAHARTEGFARRVMAAQAELRRFAALGSCYVSVSWGKDSVCVAHLAWALGLRLPHALVLFEGRENPYALATRDAWLKRFPECDYREFREDERWGTGAVRPGKTFGGPERELGRRRITGLRADESSGRRMRFRASGLSTETSCAPIGYWSAADVWAYLAIHDLPICPVYAMTFGGALNRDKVRTASLGGERGRIFGRLDWEKAYTPIQERHL